MASNLAPRFSALSRRLPALLVFWSLGAQAIPANAPDGCARTRSAEGITEYRLDNGLRVLLAPDDTQTTTAVDLTYRVGSRNEHDGQRGLSHLLEHLVLRGTPTHPDISASFQRRDMNVKASTSAERTHYAATFLAAPATLAWYLGWHADAMVHTGVTRADVDGVLPKILDEVEAGENAPERVLRQKMRSAVFHWHRYGNDPMGTRADFANVRIDLLRAYYREYYQPDNAVLTITGKFDAAATLSAIVETLGKVPRPSRNMPADYDVESLRDGNHAITLRRRGGYPLAAAMYHVPAPHSRDHTLLLLAADMLATGGAHRLRGELVTPGLAGTISSTALGWRDYGLIEFIAALKPAVDNDNAQRILNRTVESVRLHPYTQAELDQARRRWLDGWTRAQADPLALADALSKASVSGDWRLVFLERDRVRDATLIDVQRAAERYLLRANRNQGSYIPTAEPERQPATAPIDLGPELKRYDTDVD
ncbi:M16 family metallopeptidase [Achromobacter aloeverae]|nr:pitrilysin family protein [Achromobacter aloeverae]